MAHVYIVDDDATLRQLLARRVQQAGHRVTAVGSGAEALDAVRQTGSPDVAVLDVMMPEMTGFELLPLLRQRLRCPDLPAIFISAWGSQDDVSAAQALDAMYLPKPFAAVELLTLLEERLRGQALTG